MSLVSVCAEFDNPDSNLPSSSTRIAPSYDEVANCLPSLVTNLWVAGSSLQNSRSLGAENIDSLYRVACTLILRLCALTLSNRQPSLLADLLRQPMADPRGTQLHDVVQSQFSAWVGHRPLLLPSMHSHDAVGEPTGAPSPDDGAMRKLIEQLEAAWPNQGNVKLDTDPRDKVHWLGGLYEHLQRFSVRPQRQASPGSIVTLVARRGQRKSAGLYYTPLPIVEHLVEQVVGRSFDEWLAARGAASKSLVGLANKHFQVLDPAAGSGNFLVAAWHVLTQRWLAWLERSPQLVSLLLERSQLALADKTSASDPTGVIGRLVATQCIYGLDRDPVAADLARLALWQLAGGRAEMLDDICAHVRSADALLGGWSTSTSAAAGFNWQKAFPQVFHRPQRSGFDAVIGNPPYGANLSTNDKKRLCDRYPQMRHNSDTAVGFVQLSLELVRDDGRVGLVLPKPLTYSYAWRHVRELVGPRIESLGDLSCAWPDVRLEQVTLTLGPAKSRDEYPCEVWREGRPRQVFCCPQTWISRFGTLPCALTTTEAALLDNWQTSHLTLGDVCKTFRGLPCQRNLVPSGGEPVIGGRDLQRWGLRSTSGYLSTSAAAKRAARFQRPKLVFQNIVAHIQRPTPHIRLIGAYDPHSTITLDTVNNLVPKQPHVDLHAILALLHSRLVNWFVFAVVYNKAIRTMHFDQYFLDKIPLPPAFNKLQSDLAECARTAAAALAAGDVVAVQDAHLQIDCLVDTAYGVTPAER